LTQFTSHLKWADKDAGIAQLVEHDLAKVGVASSSLVSRSKYFSKPRSPGVLFFKRHADTLRAAQAMAGWQSGHAADCKSAYAGSIPTSASIAFQGAPALAVAPFFFPSPDGEIGRRKGLKIPHPQGYVGSSPTPGTRKGEQGRLHKAGAQKRRQSLLGFVRRKGIDLVG
jgi:hypothetical protein